VRVWNPIAYQWNDAWESLTVHVGVADDPRADTDTRAIACGGQPMSTDTRATKAYQ
jgi:hypothetical protein